MMLNKMNPIFLDYAATTPLDPRVWEKMSECLLSKTAFGNSSSLHGFGKEAAAWIEKARQSIADLVNTVSRNIIFTSGATEANNLAIKGVMAAFDQKKHLITVETEHASVLEVCRYLESQGFRVSYLKPDRDGLVTLDALQAAIRADTALVSMMQVNNETGVIQNIAEFGAFLRTRDIYFHVDAAQSLGKLTIDLQQLAVDLMSFSAHKIYGPKGIGALYVNDVPRVRLSPLLHGGGQERKWRAGTLATHQIVGFGETCRLLQGEMLDDNKRIARLSARFWQRLKLLPNVALNIDQTKSVAHLLNIHFPTIKEIEWIENLSALAISSASACNSISRQPSFVLQAMGYNESVARHSVRFSFGRFTSDAEIDQALTILQERLGAKNHD
jgi:cysteine desulfurase